MLPSPNQHRCRSRPEQADPRSRRQTGPGRLTAVSALADVAIPLGTAVIAAGAAVLAIRFGDRNDAHRWLREQRRAAYLALLATTSVLTQPDGQTASFDDHREAWQASDAVDLLGPEEVVAAGRHLYEVAAAIFRYSVTKSHDELDPANVLAMADEYARTRRHFADLARAALT
jgi:hypothetical protein